MQDVAAVEFVAEFFFAGEDEAVFGGEELLAFAEDGVADDGVVFVGTEDDAEGGVVVWGALEVVEEADLHVHLADVSVGELLGFEINEDEALQQVVVEDQIDVEVAGFRADAELASDEGEAFAQLHEEVAQTSDEGIFEFAFGGMGVLGEAEEFEDVGVFDEF